MTEEFCFEATVSNWYITLDEAVVTFDKVTKETISMYPDGKYEIILANVDIHDNLFEELSAKPDSTYVVNRDYLLYNEVGEHETRSSTFRSATIKVVKTINNTDEIGKFVVYITGQQ